MISKSQSVIWAVNCGFDMHTPDTWIGTDDNIHSLVQHARQSAIEEIARRFLDPEDWGFAVTMEVRDEMRGLLGIPKCES